MKRRQQHADSLARRVARVLDAVAAARIGFTSGGIRCEVGDEEGSSWAELGRATRRLGPVLERKCVGQKEWADKKE
jgi:hypothetical protein